MSFEGYCKEISNRLEEGWTLLNQHCPIPTCCTPLLRDPQRKVYCAKCGMFCISSEEATSFGISPDKAVRHSADKGAAHQLDGREKVRSENTARDAEDVRTAAEERMGQKLLLGWTMLADQCPTSGCCFPLMLDEGGTIVCVACGSNGISAEAPDTAATHEDNIGSSMIPSVPSPNATEAVKASAKEAGAPLLVPAEEFATIRQKRDALSASLGMYMLQGWSLLETTCPRDGCEPGTPLLKNRGDGRLLCASCDTYMHVPEGQDGPMVLESASSSSTALPLKRDSSGESRKTAKAHRPPAARTTAMQVESEYEKAERARLRKQAAREQENDSLGSSASLADRLLQGWAMLSTVCPKAGCHNPLMRDREGTEMCVKCGAPTTATTPKESLSAQPPGDVAGEMDIDDSGQEDAVWLDSSASRKYADQRAAAVVSARTAAARSASTGGVDYDVVRRQALDALYKALDAAQARLRSCAGAPVDVDESARQADLIAKLAIAARAVSDLPCQGRRE